MVDEVRSRDSRLRLALWMLLYLSVAVNAIASAVGTSAVSTVLSILFGTITLLCAGGLVASNYRNRHH